MQTTDTQESVSTPNAAESALEWEVRLGDRSPEKRWVVLFAALAAGTAGLLLTGSPLAAIAGVIVILVSTAEIFLPIRYRLDADGARSKCGPSVTAIGWNSVRRMVPQVDGVRLSPLKNPSRLDAFRGVYLRFSSNEEQVLGKIRAFWNEDAGRLGSTTD